MYLDKCDKDLIHFRAFDVWNDGDFPSALDSGYYSTHVIERADDELDLGTFTGQLWREVERMRRET